MLTETTLEMHFHEPIFEAIRRTFGLGGMGILNFYKYSPQKECFVGFDQAFVNSQLEENDLFRRFSRAATQDSYRLENGTGFVGYFLQYKVVSKFKKRSKNVPLQFAKPPFFAAELDTARNQRTGFSQHELLSLLSRNNPGALVYYACPMIFDKESLYERPVNVDLLRLVDIGDCQSLFQDNQKHRIYFESPVGQAFWCSEPARAKTIPLGQFAERLLAEAKSSEARVRNQKLYAEILALKNTNSLVSDKEQDGWRGVLGKLGESMTIIHFAVSE